jgi:hypothetical protein
MDSIFQLEEVHDTSARLSWIPFDDLLQDGASYWTEESWPDMSEKEERSDKDTAIALLEALEEYGSGEAPNSEHK